MNAKTLQALGDELQPALIAGELVHPRHGADFVKIGGAFSLLGAVGLDQNQADHPLIAVGSRFDGRQPRFFIQQQRQRLRREKRPFRQWQQIKRVGQNIGGGDDGIGDCGFGSLAFAHDLRFQSFDFVISHAVSRG